MSKKQQPKILIDDNRPIHIKFLRRKPERGGIYVYVAYNERECPEILREAKPEWILPERMIPETDSMETYRRLKPNSGGGVTAMLTHPL